MVITVECSWAGVIAKVALLAGAWVNLPLFSFFAQKCKSQQFLSTFHSEEFSHLSVSSKLDDMEFILTWIVALFPDKTNIWYEMYGDIFAANFLTCSARTSGRCLFITTPPSPSSPSPGQLTSPGWYLRSSALKFALLTVFIVENVGFGVLFSSLKVVKSVLEPPIYRNLLQVKSG